MEMTTDQATATDAAQFTLGPQVNAESTEVAVQPEDVVQPHQPPPETEEQRQEQVVTEARLTTARAQLMQAQAQELREAWAIAKILTNSTSINPEFQANAPEAARTKWKKRRGGSGYDKEITPPLGEQAVYNGAVAIVYGAKLGWTPEESLMRVFSVHGKPSIEAKDALAFIRRFIDHRIATGVCAPSQDGGDDIWPVEESDTRAVWYSRRNGREVSVEWTMERAETAGYTSNDKYQTNPEPRQGIEGLRAHRAALQAGAQPATGEAKPESEPSQDEPVPEEPGQQDTPHEPQDQPGATDVPAPDSPATPEQLQAILAIYDKTDLDAHQMLDDLSTFLQRQKPLHRLQEITYSDAADVIRHNAK
jgi:hypothetical protein